MQILEEAKFILPDGIEIPAAVQYISKAVTSCPVDVEIYAPDGTYITKLKDGVESDLKNDYGRFAVVYRDYTESYAKVICMSQEGDYHFKIVGADDGLVDFEMATKSDDAVELYSFTNKPISDGVVYEVSTDELIAGQIYNIDTNGDGAPDQQELVLTSDESSYVPVTGMELSETEMTLNVGDSKLLSVAVTPNTSTRQNVIWFVDDDEVASIKDGKITASSVGTAIIKWV